jgi:hypothetical protein
MDTDFVLILIRQNRGFFMLGLPSVEPLPRASLLALGFSETEHRHAVALTPVLAPCDSEGRDWFEGKAVLAWLESFSATPLCWEIAWDKTCPLRFDWYCLGWAGQQVILNLETNNTQDPPIVAWMIEANTGHDPRSSPAPDWTTVSSPISMPVFFEALSMTLFNQPLPDSVMPEGRPSDLQALYDQQGLETALPEAGGAEPPPTLRVRL